MSFEIQRWWVLILIPLSLIFIYYISRKLRVDKLRKRIMLFFRCTIAILLILALSNMAIKWTSKEITTIFLADLSDSVKTEKNQIDEFIKDSIKYKNKNDYIGVTAFGEEAIVDSFISKNFSFSGVQSTPKGIYTNFETAIHSAFSIIPEYTKKRIVLITDGEENSGNILSMAALLKEKGIDFKVKKVEKITGEEVSVEGIDLPQNLSIGGEFNVVVTINSTINTDAEINLFSGEESKLREKVKLNKGENKFVFKDIAIEGGFINYKVTINAVNDTNVKNNEATAFTDIKDRPRILVVQDNEGEANEIIKILQASGIEYDLLRSSSLPTTLENLSKYKSVITCNVSAENLSDKFLNILESYVKDIGGGFVAVGGDNSFALGGYFETPLETILPVYMDLRGRKEIPSMALNLVIDKSGSMSGAKLALAKEAATRTLDALREQDEIGVLTFDDSQFWVVERQQIKNKEAIAEDIGTIREGGGTSILPAIEEAYESLKESNAKIKHIILLTDGQAERTGYEELIEEMNKDGITISTVAIGNGSDTVLLENIAKKGNGRYYYSDEATNVPRIFAKEAFMASRTYLNNEEFTPVIENYSSILSGVADNGLPNLLGYIGSSPKDTAQVVLKSSEEDPILTMWRYGLGKTIAWNSDMSGKWSSNYISWENNMKLWQNIINWTIDNYESSDSNMEVNLDGSKAKIKFTTKDLESVVDTEVEVLTPSMEKKTVKLYPSSPGEYSGEMDLNDTGVYILKGIQKNGNEILSTAKAGVNLPYSPEYNIGNTSAVLDDLVKAIDGKFIEEPQEVFQGNLDKVQGKKDLTNIFLIIALIFFILDIAFRRLNPPVEKFQQKLKNLAKNKNKSGSKEKIIVNKSFTDELKNKNIKDKRKSKEVEKVVEEMEISKLSEKKLVEKKEMKEKIKETKKESNGLLNTDALLNNKKKK
ncbi:VWA domain-containing protein [Clostridium grantii]|uniref:Putative glutamine amidotransferase n=1 Tax=Clostridium grantii DSM 8605 TaxID=1121316 RepID=A0A1M5XAS6_9CLOT|nr:VWA domain-containing protein [Clostridium grantii]SHH96886.1 Putative glutamine amidotransferase [Clostridium grantii DSM 8605]